MTTCPSAASETTALPLEQRLCEPIAAILLSEGWDTRDVLHLDGDLHALLLRVGARILQCLLQTAVDQAVGAARATGLKVHRSPSIEVWSLLGPVSLVSPYLRDARTHRNERPADVRLGLFDGWRSPALERALASFGANLPFARAADLYQEHYGWHPTAARTRRVTESVAEKAQAYVEERLASPTPLPRDEQVQRMLVESDGCLLRTGEFSPKEPPARTAVRAIPAKQRTTVWKEVRTALARPLQPESDTATYVARRGSHQTVCDQLHAAACERGLGPETQVHAVADGGTGLKEALQRTFAPYPFTFTLDRWHLQEDFYEAADALGLKGRRRQEWVEECMELLDGNEVESVREKLLNHQGRGQKRLRRLGGHLTEHHDDLDYDRKREAGLPIGSGEVESSQRTLPQARLKVAGATWKEEHLNSMLALRVVREDGWWAAFQQQDIARRLAMRTARQAVLPNVT